MSISPPLTPQDFEDLVQDHLDCVAGPDAEEVLSDRTNDWVRVLLRRLDETDQSLEDLRQRLSGPERDLVVADFEDERRRIDEVLTALIGPAEPVEKPREVKAVDLGEAAAVPVQLQLSWTPGRIIAWAANPAGATDAHDDLVTRLKEAGAGTVGWESYQRIRLPDGPRSDTVAAPIGSCLGWLVSLGTAEPDERMGAGARWLGAVAAQAVRLVAQGRMVPTLKKARRPAIDGALPNGHSSFEVRWVPTLINADVLSGLVDSRPGSVGALQNRQDPRAFTMSVLTDLVSAISGNAADRLEVPAPPPDPRSKAEVGEAMLGRLGGEAFVAPGRLGGELGRRLDQWARPVSGPAKVTLVVQLDPPDDVGAWYLAVLAPNGEDALEPVETALVTSSNTRSKEVQDQLKRLERIFPELLRPGARRRGEVVLSQDEAWDLMTVRGEALAAAGFDVRLPALSRRKPTPELRLTSEDTTESVVGAQQLANVRWSAVFDDIELTSEDVQCLAREAKPLVRSRGQWIELDHADLAEAAAALAERADTTQLTGADMLRHALGLEGTPLGGITLAGDNWAAELLASADEVPTDPDATPEGFDGELRSYQAEALVWLEFLDGAGLGGCLALDMGLGKTPTLLAHLRNLDRDHGSLVVAPPAVVGNWAAEAARFTPDLDVRIHHGPNRAAPGDLPDLAETADVILTTYGTAVRDMEALSEITWAKVVLDEAQAIKNPASETAQQLKRLEAGGRIALTGTPIENGLGDLWAIMEFANPGLVGPRPSFIAQLSKSGSGSGSGAERALRALNGILVFRRTKAEPAIAAELPDRIDELDHCAMTTEQIGLYQAVLDKLVVETAESENTPQKKGAVLAAITALKQICNHPVNYEADDRPLDGRSGKLARLNEIVDSVFASGERMLVFTHFASWGEKLAGYLTERTGIDIHCYHGGLGRTARDRLIEEFQNGSGPGAMVLSLKAGGTGLNLTAASHVVLYDRWWNPAVEDQARDRVWRIGQTSTVICHRLVCPGTVDERVEEVVAGKRQIADMVLPKSSSIGDLDAEQLQRALGIDAAAVLAEDVEPVEILS